MSTSNRKPPPYSHALMLNALIFPGSGQIALGLRRLGYFFIATSTFCIIWPLARYTAAVFLLMKAEPSGETPLLQGLQAFSTAWTHLRSELLSCFLGLIVIWLVSLGDILWRWSRTHHEEKGTR